MCSFINMDKAIFLGQFCSRGKSTMRITLNPATCTKDLTSFLVHTPKPLIWIVYELLVTFVLSWCPHASRSTVQIILYLLGVLVVFSVWIKLLSVGIILAVVLTEKQQNGCKTLSFCDIQESNGKSFLASQYLVALNV